MLTYDYLKNFTKTIWLAKNLYYVDDDTLLIA